MPESRPAITGGFQMLVQAILLCVVALLGYAIYIVVDTGQMSDAERAELGLGPKYKQE